MTLDDIGRLESEWIGRILPDDPDCLDWQPFDTVLFMTLLDACMPHVGNRIALDAGCGIGTKCILMSVAGLDTYGVDRVPEYVEEACRLGVNAELNDVRSFDRYDRFGLVYVNHPLSPAAGDAEARLEAAIQEEMASGSVLLSANYAVAPDWIEITRHGEWNAAWVKP